LGWEGTPAGPLTGGSDSSHALAERTGRLARSDRNRTLASACRRPACDSRLRDRSAADDLSPEVVESGRRESRIRSAGRENDPDDVFSFSRNCKNRAEHGQREETLPERATKEKKARTRSRSTSADPPPGARHNYSAHTTKQFVDAGRLFAPATHFGGKVGRNTTSRSAGAWRGPAARPPAPTAPARRPPRRPPAPPGRPGGGSRHVLYKNIFIIIIIIIIIITTTDLNTLYIVPRNIYSCYSCDLHRLRAPCPGCRVGRRSSSAPAPRRCA